MFEKMMSAHWSNHFRKFSKIDWWYYSIQTFYLNSIFSWFRSFFFITTAEQCTNIKYVSPKMSLRSAKSEAGKNSSIKNRVLFSKNVVSFLSTSFCMFLINVGIFSNSFKTWLLILIHLIKHHNFFLFAAFISIVFQNFKVFVLCMIFCLQSFVWK